MHQFVATGAHHNYGIRFTITVVRVAAHRDHGRAAAADIQFTTYI